VIGTIPPPAATAPPVTSGAPAGPSTLRFEPGTISLKPGDTTTVGIVVENVKDLSSIPMLLQYNPAVISVEEVRHGGFLSADSQAAIVQQPNQAHGQEIISVTRTPNSAGISGTGTVVAVVIKALAPGNSQLSIVQVNARDSQQRPIQLVTVEGAVKVQ
jgi:general secretion pathway protein D